MLEQVVTLSTLDLSLKPFDQAILAAILVRAEELRSAGEVDLCFCEADADLQPPGTDAATQSSRSQTYTTRLAYGCMAIFNLAIQNALRIGRNDRSYSA